MKLIAKRPVLYLGRMYPAGAALPADNPAMVAAWLRADSAKDVSKPDAAAPVEDVSNLDTVAPAEPVSNLDTADELEPTAEELAASSDYPEVEDADIVSNLGTAPAESRESLMDHTKEELETMVRERGLTAPRAATKSLLVELLLQTPAAEGED